MTSTRRSLLVATSAVLTSVAACGGAPARSPDSSESSVGARDAHDAHEPTTVEEAEEQIDRARTSLGIEPASPSAPSPPSPPPAAAPPPSEVKVEGKKSSAEPELQCSSPCRALASMRRAVNALCRMTGNDDQRCHDARKTLQESVARVTPCSC